VYGIDGIASSDVNRSSEYSSETSSEADAVEDGTNAIQDLHSLVAPMTPRAPSTPVINAKTNMKIDIETRLSRNGYLTGYSATLRL
jgi:hypothetical protein